MDQVLKWSAPKKALGLGVKVGRMGVVHLYWKVFSYFYSLPFQVPPTH